MLIYKVIFSLFIILQIYYFLNDISDLKNSIINCFTINNNIFLHNLLTLFIEYLCVVFMFLNITNNKPYFVLCSIYILLMIYGLFIIIHMNNYCMSYFALRFSSAFIIFAIKLFFSCAILLEICKIYIDKLLDMNIKIKIE